MFDFNKKVALITGGTTGIGFSTAMMMAESGATVAVAGRRESKGQKALTRLKEINKNCIFIAADVSNTATCQQLVQETVSRLGSLDILVNSAGVFMEGPIETFSEEENIRVNCVCPGDVLTPMFDKEAARSDDPQDYFEEIQRQYPVGRVGTPEEVAATICFLASEVAPFVVGAAWSIDGGLTAFSY